MVKAKTAVSGRGASSIRVAVAALMVTMVAGACTVPPGPVDPVTAGLRPAVDVSLGDDELVVEWSTPSSFVGRYEVEARSSSTGWVPLAVTTDTSIEYSTVISGQTYLFRVRALPTGTAPGEWSTEASALYVDLVLPVVRIDTGDTPILDKETYVPASLDIDPNGSGFQPYSGTTGIRGRGNSTWTYPKKPYRLKLDSASPIMGMASERDWVLLANYIERSQIRTVLAMEAARATRLPYTPTLRHVEVVIDGEYQGVYLLTQHTELGANRINVTKMGSSDNAGTAVTGGYLLELDFRLEQENEPGFRTAAQVPVVVKDPDPLTAQQTDFIRNRVQAFENALMGPNFTNPTTGYRAFLDVDSFIDHYLVQELTRNQDAFHASTYFTKERGDPLFRFGPVWDFDRSIGTDAGVFRSPEGWSARLTGPWLPRLFQDPAFVDQVEQRWRELKPAFVSIANSAPTRAAALAPAVRNDSARWSYSIGAHDQTAFIVDWLDTRIAWLDAEFTD